MLPHDFPRWEAVSHQTQRWIAAGCFAAMVHDLRALLRWSAVRADQPTAVILDSATRQSTPESGHRAGYDGYKRKQGTKIHAAVDTLSELLALQVTPANANDREQVAALTEDVQAITGQTVEVGFVDQGYTGGQPKQRRPRTASACRSSSWRRPGAASCSCRGAGSSNPASPGPRGSVGWPRITNACRKRSRACISWPSPP
jgi:transposase